MTTARTGYAGTQSVGDVLTSANFTKLSNGLVAYSPPVTSMQTNIGTTLTDVTGLITPSFTAGTSRLYVVYVTLRVTIGTSVSSCTVQVRDDASTTIDFTYELNTVASTAGGTYRASGWSQPWFPTAGAHTAKASVAFGANTNNQAGGFSSTQTAWIGVYDMGPSF